jgi:hypothetical protein
MVGISVEDGFEGCNHPFRLNQVSFRLNQMLFCLNQVSFRLNQMVFCLNQLKFRLNPNSIVSL